MLLRIVYLFEEVATVLAMLTRPDEKGGLLAKPVDIIGDARPRASSKERREGDPSAWCTVEAVGTRQIVVEVDVGREDFMVFVY